MCVVTVGTPSKEVICFLEASLPLFVCSVYDLDYWLVYMNYAA